MPPDTPARRALVEAVERMQYTMTRLRVDWPDEPHSPSEEAIFDALVVLESVALSTLEVLAALTEYDTANEKEEKDG